MKDRKLILTVFTLVIISLDGLALRFPASPVFRETGRKINTEVADPARQQVLMSYGKLPLYFEANHGQTDPRVKFLARGRGYTLFLTSTEAVWALRKSQAKHSSMSPDPARKPEPQIEGQTVVRMKLVGGNPAPRVIGQEELEGKANYFIGNNSKKWRTNIPTYAKVAYSDVYQRVDLVYHGNQRQLEYDFVVRPGADPKAIALRYAGVDKLEVNTQGDLVLHTGDGVISQQKPVIYQEVNGVRREIAGGYVLRDAHQVGFGVAAYDTSQPLVIDPVLFYSTYLGGSGEEFLNGSRNIAVDLAGNAYATGRTTSTNFPTSTGAFQTTNAGGFADSFVAKLNPTGSALVYSTYLGGSANDEGLGIAVDAAGNGYAVGFTEGGFPITSGAFQTTFGGSADGYVTKLNPTGSALVYSSYLGGSGQDTTRGIAVDSAGNAYVMGGTNSTNFPTMNPIQASNAGGSEDAFVAKLNAAGSALVYSTYLGGNDLDQPQGLAIDSAGNAYVAGSTRSSNFPTTFGAFQTTFFGGPEDGFVTKLNATGSAFVYSTYLGRSAEDGANGVESDSAGNAYVTGHTESSNFPTTAGAFQTTYAGSQDAFVTKLNPLGTGLVYSTYLGGSGTDGGLSITLDGSFNAYVAGFTCSTNFPMVNPIQAALAGGCDAFVTKVNVLGTGLDYSTYLGGSGSDQGSGIVLDALPNPNAYVIGITNSSNFPTTTGAFQTTYGGGTYDAFVVKIANIVLPPGATSGKVTGGGTIDVTGGIANFGFIVQAQLATGQIRGDLQYHNHASGAKLQSVMFTTFVLSSNMATFSGTCTQNNAPCTFSVEVEDNGEPGTSDTFTISINGGAPEGGTLRSGNIQIHKQ